jgi:hypothetical protein
MSSPFQKSFNSKSPLNSSSAERKRSGGVRGETPFFDAGHGLTVGKHNHPSLAPPDTNDDSEDSTADKNKGYTQWRYDNGNKKDNKRNLAKYKKFLADKESNKNEGN